MKAALPFAQALLDINEINARRLAALKEGELPSARGNSFEEVQTELARKLKEFLAAKFQENNAEMEAFGKATENGRKKSPARSRPRSRSGLKKPATTVPFRAPEF